MCCCKTCSWFVTSLIYLFIYPSIHSVIHYFLCWMPTVYHIQCTKIKRLPQHVVRLGVPPVQDWLAFRQVFMGSNSLPGRLPKFWMKRGSETWLAGIARTLHFSGEFSFIKPKGLLCKPPVLIDLLVVWQILAGVALPLHLYLRAQMFAWCHGVRFGDWK